MRARPVCREGSADRLGPNRLVLILCLLAAGRAVAEDPAPADEAPPAAPPVRRVGEVTANATRAEREVLDVAGNTTVIDRAEIERSGARTLPELLRRESGLFVTNTSTNPAGTFVDARGFNNGGGNGAGLLVLVDGVRQNEPDTGSTDWPLVPLEMVEEVEIVRGPASALYGDGAVGGVIHIRTRPHEGPPRAALRGLYGSWDSAGGSLRASGSVEGFTGSLLVDGLRSDGFRQRSAYDSQDFRGSVQGPIGERVVVGSSGAWHHDDRQFPGALTRAEVDLLGRRAASPRADEDRGRVQSGSWNAWLEAELAPEVRLRVAPSWWSRDDSARITSLFSGTTHVDTNKQQTGVDAQLRIDRPLGELANRVVVGGTFLRDEAHRDTAFSFPGLPQGRLGSDGERNAEGVFLQEELWAHRDVLLAAGVRFDAAQYRLKVRDRVTGDEAHDRPHLTAWSPKLSATWRFLPTASAYAAWSRGFRFPDFDEDLPLLGFPPGSPPTLPDLDPQRSDDFEVGAKLESDRATAGLTLYWMKVRDEILFDPESFANLNLDRVRHRGIEVSGSLRVHSWLLLSGAYTFDDVKILDAGSNAFGGTPTLDGARMPITPKHRGTLGALFESPWGVELAANANLVGPRSLANDFDGQVGELGFHATLDFLLRARLADLARAAGLDLGRHVAPTLAFALRNATNEKYSDFGVCGGCLSGGMTTAYVNPAAGRSFEIALTLELTP
jgi:iron complex outermembrane receptor protein